MSGVFILGGAIIVYTYGFGMGLILFPVLGGLGDCLRHIYIYLYILNGGLFYFYGVYGSLLSVAAKVKHV